MRVEVNVDADNIIRNAVSTGTMWAWHRGDPQGTRSARTPGPSPSASAASAPVRMRWTSVRAVENALGISIPENANSIRNIMQLTLQVHDHLVPFLPSACARLGGRRPRPSRPIPRQPVPWPNPFPIGRFRRPVISVTCRAD